VSSRPAQVCAGSRSRHSWLTKVSNAPRPPCTRRSTRTTRIGSTLSMGGLAGLDAAERKVRADGRGTGWRLGAAARAHLEPLAATVFGGARHRERVLLPR